MRPVSIKISSINFFAPVICLMQLNSPAVVSPRINSSTSASLCRGYWAQLIEVCGAVEPQRDRNQLSSSVYANKTLRHGSGNQHIWIKNSVESNLKPEYAKRTPLVDFFCKRVTIMQAGNQSKSQSADKIIDIKAFCRCQSSFIHTVIDV